MNPPADITALLQAWNQGDMDARDRLMPAVYDELRRRAAAFLRRERPGQTLQPTALVHEVYLRLVDQDRAVWQNRAQFLAVAAEMMRRILVDRARAHKMAKRSGRWARVTLTEDAAQGTPRDVDVLDLNNALDELSAFDSVRPASPNSGSSAGSRSKRPDSCWAPRSRRRCATGRRRGHGSSGA